MALLVRADLRRSFPDVSRQAASQRCRRPTVGRRGGVGEETRAQREEGPAVLSPPQSAARMRLEEGLRLIRNESMSVRPALGRFFVARNFLHDFVY
jgi:hypothetical protein